MKTKIFATTTYSLFLPSPAYHFLDSLFWSLVDCATPAWRIRQRGWKVNGKNMLRCGVGMSRKRQKRTKQANDMKQPYGWFWIFLPRFMISINDLTCHQCAVFFFTPYISWILFNFHPCFWQKYLVGMMLPFKWQRWTGPISRFCITDGLPAGFGNNCRSPFPLLFESYQQKTETRLY